ncbi:MAG: hypothetical protein HZR80_06720 [Candidatus Heimdallarchaeota archaeon]
MNLFTGYMKKCDECTKTIHKCNQQLQEMKKFVNDGIKQIRFVWEAQKNSDHVLQKKFWEEEISNQRE